jgi:hypothetical protein
VGLFWSALNAAADAGVTRSSKVKNCDTAVQSIAQQLQNMTTTENTHHSEVLTYIRRGEAHIGDINEALTVRRVETVPQMQRVTQEVGTLVALGTAHHQEITTHLFGQDGRFQEVLEVARDNSRGTRGMLRTHSTRHHEITPQLSQQVFARVQPIQELVKLSII